ncbi:hypothetical protein RRG08_061894 [Elysia crispata]|uniref:LYR motif-containing protein 2 n=1 Tax=Elysia crispata TaxID=231223 RepID=A0AAE0XM28_9GAST|nr:hypothetical protein RRG08_061894 [Elysia crispata]
MPAAQLTLKQFMLRTEVLKLYRSMLRVTYRIDDLAQRKNLQQWIRTDFDNNKDHSDELAVPVHDNQSAVQIIKSFAVNILPPSSLLRETLLKEAIRMMLSKGKLSLRELEQAVGLVQ